MPYYIYRLKPFGQLEKLSEFETFKLASTQAKSMRAAQVSEPAERFKIMFAETELEAEDLLSQVRTPGPTGDE